MDLHSRWILFLVIVVGGSACRRSTSAPGVAEAPTPPGPERIEPTPVLRPPGAIYRGEIRRATGRGPAYLLRQVQPEPHRPQGQFQGWRINAVFPDDPTLCEKGCDLVAGDIIVSVNGNNLERPEQLTALLQDVEHASSLEVVRLRNGIRESKRYPIVPDPAPP